MQKSEIPLSDTTLREKMLGALYGRCAGCILGVPVENFSVEKMRKIAAAGGMTYPPEDYWTEIENPEGLQYDVEARKNYGRDRLCCAPVDDDTTYVALNLLLLERYGFEYTLEDTAAIWKELLPYACTAEEQARNGLNAGKAAEICGENPYNEWIGAAIRGDAFGYVCAGDPSAAAKLCFNDARLSHRNNGIYGEMFTAGAVAAAFTAAEPLDAAVTAANLLPDCELKRQLYWAFEESEKIEDYLDARRKIDERFSDMHCVHTINNMCAVVFALALGKGDFTKNISSSIAIGLDNDCNGATVGSIAGACLGADKIPAYWYRPFHDKFQTYLRGHREFSFAEMAERFVALYKKRELYKTR